MLTKKNGKLVRIRRYPFRPVNVPVTIQADRGTIYHLTEGWRWGYIGTQTIPPLPDSPEGFPPAMLRIEISASRLRKKLRSGAWRIVATEAAHDCSSLA